MDTQAETSIFCQSAITRFPPDRVFHGSNSKFKLTELVDRVKRSKNVIVLLSPNYPRRTFTMVELHYALRYGANVRTVKVERAGLGTFDFDKLLNDIKTGELFSYLKAEDWATLAEHDITLEVMADNLLKVMDVVAVDFSVKHPLPIQQSMLDFIFKDIVVD